MSGPEPWVLHEQDCDLESWNDETRGRVQWRTLLSGDRMPTGSLTMGVAELPPGGPLVPRTHWHAQVEAYYVLAGEGIVSLAGVDHPVRAGSVVFVPGDTEHGAANTGTGTLRILYVFAADSFDQVEYRFSQPEGQA